MALPSWHPIIYRQTSNIRQTQFSATNLVLAGFPITYVISENMHVHFQNMFNLHLCSSATVWYLQSKFGHVHLYDIYYVYSKPQYCKCSSFGCIEAMNCGCSCHGPHKDSAYSGSEPKQSESPWLVKRAVGFPSPQWVLIGSNQFDTIMTRHITENTKLCISNHNHYKVWDEITYPFLNFNDTTVEV